MTPKVLTSWSLVWLLATVLLIAGGALHVSQRAYHKLPATDGVAWQLGPDGGIYADHVEPGFAGSRAGVSRGDRLVGIEIDGAKGDEIVSPSDVEIYLEAAGEGGSLTYFIIKPYSFENHYFAELKNLDTQPRWPPSVIFLSFVGIVWLIVGIFVLFKQGGHAPFVLHFANICLAAFVFHVYRPLYLGEDFDLAVSILDNTALALFGPIFLHFCLRYPVRSEVFGAERWRTFALYVPASLVSAAIVFFTLIPAIFPTTGFVEWMTRITDQLELIPLLNLTNERLTYLYVGAGAIVLARRFLKNKQPIVRQRLKWAMWGTIGAVLPVASLIIARRFFYLPNDFSTLALTTLPLALIPISFGHSVVRYRLMDVDVVVRRALVYAITTVAIAAMIGAVALGLVFLAIGDNLSTTEITLRAVIAVIAMAGIVLLSEPLKKFLQERADRFFYGERYDLRRSLLDFGRTLSATTALDPLMNALTERLRQVLDVEKVAVFVEDEENPTEFRIAKSVGLSDAYRIPNDFRQMIRQKSAKKGIVRADELDFVEAEPDLQTALEFASDGIEISKMPETSAAFVRQELHYFVPCVIRGRMIAVIGLGRGSDGSLLSSEDLEILRTVSGYVAVAVENSLLYQEQEKRAEELALLKDFNESIVESVNVGLLAVDETGSITRCNSTFEEMLGLERDKTIGRLVEDVFDRGFARNLDSILGKSRWHLTEIRHAYKLHTNTTDGKSLILNVAVAPLRSVSHSQTGAIIVLENVTSRVKLEETLQQSEKLSSIGLLAAGVAHEVNTPLTGVSSYTQMLLGMIPETDPKHALLLKVQKQTDRATNIAGNLLNFSRGGNSTEYVEVDVNKLLDDTLQLLEPQMRKAEISVIKKYWEIPPKIRGNAGKLQQVFTNLVLNARDAMLSGGEITLSTSIQESGDVLIKVSDNGEGISSENLSKIYDPFFTTKAVGSGTGLGLAVSYGIVQEHSGAITADSVPGEGTTFNLVFPPFEEKRQRAVS